MNTLTDDELDNADDGWDEYADGCGIPGCDCMYYNDAELDIEYWNDEEDGD